MLYLIIVLFGFSERERCCWTTALLWQLLCCCRWVRCWDHSRCSSLVGSLWGWTLVSKEACLWIQLRRFSHFFNANFDLKQILVNRSNWGFNQSPTNSPAFNLINTSTRVTEHSLRETLSTFNEMQHVDVRLRFQTRVPQMAWGSFC